MAEDDDLPPSYDEVMKAKLPASSPGSNPATVRTESLSSSLPTISESEEEAETASMHSDDHSEEHDDRRSHTSTIVDETEENGDEAATSTARTADRGTRRVRRVTIGESETIEIDMPEPSSTPRESRVYPLEQFMTDNPYKYLALRHGWTPTPPCPHEEQEDEDDVDAPTKRRVVATILLFAFISIFIFIIAKLLEGAKHSMPSGRSSE